MKIVTSEQMRRIEERSEQAGVSTDRLMENAGLAVARSVRRRLGRVVGARVVVLAGPGNNGGDGLVAARRLLSWGADVTVYLTRDRVGDPNLDSVVARCAPVVSADEADFLRRLAADLGRAQVVVDALLGTGRSRPIAGVVETVLRALSRARVERPDLRLLAVDLPTGLDADTGLADTECVAADVTVALGYPKVGHYTGPGAGNCGCVEVVDIGVPLGLDADVRLELMTAEWAECAPAGPPVRRAQGDVRARADRGWLAELRWGGEARGYGGRKGRGGAGHAGRTREPQGRGSLRLSGAYLPVAPGVLPRRTFAIGRWRSNGQGRRVRCPSRRLRPWAGGRHG